MKTELLDAYLSGEIRGESAVFIETALKNDDALREAYFQQVRMDAALRVLLADEALAEVTPDRFAAAIMARLATDQESTADRRFAKSVLMELMDERGIRPRSRMQGWDWAKAGLITAAVLVFLLFLLQSVRLDSGAAGGSAKVAEHFVAQVTNASAGADWGHSPVTAMATDEASTTRDGWLQPGRLALRSGILEITFTSGARVVLESPAVLNLERPMRAFLESGRLTAEVPKAATGFVINTPRLNVVDIGTRFGLKVDTGGDTEVHVMQGLVEVSRLSGNAMPIVLAEGLAVRADERTRSSLQPIEYGGDRFALTVASAAPAVGYVHYGFNESGGPEIADEGRGLEGGPYEGTLLMDDSGPRRPMRSVGRSGGGLVFAPGEGFDSPVLGGFDSTGAVSLALWLRLPPGAPDGETGGVAARLLASGNGPEPEKTLWEIGWNGDPMAGKTGALQVRGGDAAVIGTSDLQDGRWHHVAFRFIGGKPQDATTHLHLYVDGQLEAITGHRSAPAAPGVVNRLRLGGEGGFKGAVDDVFAFSGAVAPGLVQRLAEEIVARK